MATGGSQKDPNPHICVVCLDKLQFRDPKFLPCFHTFCASCIQDLADCHPGSSFPCPSCRQMFTLPSGGVASLQTNFYIQPLTVGMCPRHAGERLRLYCEKCDAASICQYCNHTKPRVEVKERRPEVKVTRRFQCARDPDVKIFSLCHVDDDPPAVFVSYERYRMKKDAPAKRFTETGKRELTCEGNRKGKVSFRRFAKRRILHSPPAAAMFETYNKSPTAALYLLCNTLAGQADVKTTIVTSTDPLECEDKTEFMIQVGPHRAFDVDDSYRHFAVVEEGGCSKARCCVRLYRRSEEQAVCMYSPPHADCQPSDVCFYTLGGQEVLLITDEMKDNIHVVTIQDDTMKFQYYLFEKGSSLIQPMAITADVQGRLWVGCRGGAVLTIEQID